jgi:AraC-like DNA-binding protein
VRHARVAGVRRAQSEALIDYLNHHLRDRDLTIAKVALAHNISERYAYLLLARQGITFGDSVRTHRLAGAAQSLRDHSDTTIGRIAINGHSPTQKEN